MKKRLFSLLLAVLMVASAVSPLMFTSTASDGTSASSTASGAAPITKYEDLYVDGAILVWNAQGKTLTLDASGNAVIATTTLGSDLLLTKLSSDRASAQIIDGALEIIDYRIGGAIYSHDNKTYELSQEDGIAVVGNTYTWTTSLTYQRLDENFFGANSSVYGFSANGGVGTQNKFTLGRDGYTFLQTAMFKMDPASTRFISKENLALHDAWAGQYKAASADVTLQADTWMRIHKQDYDALIAIASFGSDAAKTGTELKAAYADNMSALKAAMLEPIPSDHDMNADEVIDGNDIYFARYDAFKHIVSTSGLNRATYYYKYDTTSTQQPFWKWGMENTQWRPYGSYNGTLYAYDVQGGYKVFTADSAAVPHNDTFVATHKVGTSPRYTWTQKYLRDNVTMLNGGTESISGTSNTNKWNLPQTFTLYGYPARIYSIAVYEKELTADEWNQNHFADLCAYYQVDFDIITSFMQLSETEKKEVYADFATVNIKDAGVSAKTFEDKISSIINARRLSLYVGGENAILIWNAKTSTLILDESGNAVIGETAWGSQLKLTPIKGSTRASARIVDGALEIIDYSLNGMLYSDYNGTKGAGVNYNYPLYDALELDTTYQWTTSMTFEHLNGVDPYNAEKDVYGFSYNGGAGFYSSNYYTINLSNLNSGLNFAVAALKLNPSATSTISQANLARHDAWAGQYMAARNSGSEELQNNTWMRIHKQDYDALASHATYGVAVATGTALKAAYADNMDALKAAMLDPIPSDYDMDTDGDIDGDDIYFARYDAFNHIVSASGLNRANYYASYNTASDYHTNFQTGIVRAQWNPYGGYNGTTYTYDLPGGTLTGFFGEGVQNHTFMLELMKVANGSSYKQNYTQWFHRDGVAYKEESITGSSTANKYNLPQSFVFSGYPARVYSLTVYNRLLTPAEEQQNHFADLANYYEMNLDLIATYLALEDAQREAVNAVYADIKIGDEGIGNSHFANTIAMVQQGIDAETIKIAASLKAEDIIALQGYQGRVFGDYGIRSRYEINTGFTLDGVTLKEVGAIMAIANDRTTADLTVGKSGDAYVVGGDYMMKAAIYDADGWKNANIIYENELTPDEKAYFAFTVVFDPNDEEIVTQLQTDMLFRGYVVLEINGYEIIYYTDMTGVLYPDGKLSMYDLAKNDVRLNGDNASSNSKAIVALVEE